MKIRWYLLFLLFLFQVMNMYAQSEPFNAPLKFPLYLSGNFGELRADHFHSGIDIKTHGTPGHEVCSAADGYISRIKVQTNGYGNSLYIAHPDGLTTVYGHLSSYRPDIADYVKRIQYERRSQEVDIYLEKDVFPVKKNEFIAKSGNSGSSSGPHLHFEVRTTADQHPTNVLKYGLDIRDHRAPVFYNLVIYPVGKVSKVNHSSDKQVYTIIGNDTAYRLPAAVNLQASGTIGFGVEVFDYLDGSPNRCGVYTLEMQVNGTPVYSQKMDEYAFSETRYINAHIDYEAIVTSGKKIHHLFRLPNDKLRIYGHLVNEGYLDAEPGKDYTIRIIASDVAGNQAFLEFQLRGVPGDDPAHAREPEKGIPVEYDHDYHFGDRDLSIDIPAYALYKDISFRYDRTASRDNTLSDLFHIHEFTTPVQRPYRFRLTIDTSWIPLKDKLMLVVKDQDDHWTYAGGEVKQGALVAELREFGTFAVQLDTIAPRILAGNGSGSTDYTGKTGMSFQVTDEQSGIGSYEGYIDNRWALFEYDPKNDRVVYYFDPERISEYSEHELELYITDKVGNVSLYHAPFFW